VPVSNFFGWFFTGYIYYQRFALCRANASVAGPGRSGSASAILFYAVLWSGQHPRSQTAHDVVWW